MPSPDPLPASQQTVSPGRFLDRICTHRTDLEGNFGDYEADALRRLGPDMMGPKRIKYRKKIVRWAPDLGSRPAAPVMAPTAAFG